MMKVTPLISTDIVGRYVKGNRCIIDTFIGMRIPTKTRKNQTKILNRLNTVGLKNGNRLQEGKQMLSVLV